LPKLPNVVKVYCNNNQLTQLPKLPKVVVLHCENNRLTQLHTLPNVITLYCDNNQLTRLPELPCVKHVTCTNNKLDWLPNLPSVLSLCCNNNQLTCLPKIPAIEYIDYGRELFYSFKINKPIWNILDLTTAFITIRRWKRFVMFNNAKKKQELHLELLYSPDLPFYIERRESQHWKSQ
jgi:Leucine-rich repeat (LRR) protein